MSYGLLEDINGDKSEKILAGLVSCAVFLVLCIIAFFVALFANISSPSVVDTVLFSVGGYSSSLLIGTLFQKLRAS